jgi:hypothetical protein
VFLVFVEYILALRQSHKHPNNIGSILKDQYIIKPVEDDKIYSNWNVTYTSQEVKCTVGFLISLPCQNTWFSRVWLVRIETTITFNPSFLCIFYGFTLLFLCSHCITAYQILLYYNLTFYSSLYEMDFRLQEAGSMRKLAYQFRI